MGYWIFFLIFAHSVVLILAPTPGNGNTGPVSTCGRYEIPTTCYVPCEATCSDRKPPACLPSVCKPGCVCAPGFIRKTIDGPCIRINRCPRCPKNETYQTSGFDCERCHLDNVQITCDPTCEEKCYCKDGYIRNDNNTCILRKDCPKLECNKPHAEITNCGSACAPTCQNRDDPPICIALCIYGCFCVPPYILDEVSQACVLPRDCPNKPSYGK